MPDAARLVAAGQEVALGAHAVQPAEDVLDTSPPSCASLHLMSPSSSATGQELDLRALHSAVQSLGGYDAVTSGRLWSRVKDALDIDPEYQNAGGVLRCDTRQWLSPSCHDIFTRLAA